VTIADIAGHLGLTKSAVSYALNSKPGVSAATRQRVLDAARELGWVPSSAARSLAGAATSTIGVVIAQPQLQLSAEHYLMTLAAGLQTRFQERGYALLMQVGADVHHQISIYQSWVAQRRVDAVVLLDPLVEDPRPAALMDLGLPVIVIGEAPLYPKQAQVRTDDAAAMTAVVEHLLDLGHRSIARVAGPAHLMHTRARDAAFEAAVHNGGGHAVVLHTDYSESAGAQATGAALAAPAAVTAVVCDSDLLAVAAFATIGSLGLQVPADVSVVAWDDSALCRVMSPPLTAVGYDIAELGRDAGRVLFDLLDRGEHEAAVKVVPQLRVRSSTGPASNPSHGPESRSAEPSTGVLR